MLKNVQIESPPSLSGGIKRHAQMLGNVGIEIALAARPRLKKLQIGSTFRNAQMLTFVDIEQELLAQTKQPGHPKKEPEQSLALLVNLGIEPAMSEIVRWHFPQFTHLKRAQGSAWMMTIDDIEPMLQNQNVQSVHPKKGAGCQPSAQAATLKKPDIDRTHCRQTRQLGHPKRGVSKLEVGRFRHPKKGESASSSGLPLWLLPPSRRTKLTPEKARGLSLATRQTAQSARAKRPDAARRQGCSDLVSLWPDCPN